MRGWMLGAALVMTAPAAWAQTGPGPACNNRLNVGAVTTQNLDANRTQYSVRATNRHSGNLMVSNTMPDAGSNLARSAASSVGMATRITPGNSHTFTLGVSPRNAYTGAQVQQWLRWRCD